MPSGDRSNKITVGFETDRCIHARSAWAECTLCSDTCPGRAITCETPLKTPTLNLDRCMQCGQCLSACPLEAFESTSFSERQLLSRVSEEGDIRLHCFLPYNELEHLTKESRTYHLGTCLAALTSGALFELALSRHCELYTDRCRSCALFARAGKTMAANVSLARSLLADWNRAGNLSESTPTLLPAPELSGGTPADDSPALKGVYGALDSIGALRSNIRSLFASKRRKPIPADAVLSVNVKRKRVPLWRQRLEKVWQRRPALPASSQIWPVLVVDGAQCKACGLCSQLCPTGSIRHVLDNGAFSYYFTPGTCVDCGLCVSSCYSKALTRSYGATDQPFEAMECLVRQASACKRCGLPVIDGNEQGICYVCRSVPEPRNLQERVSWQMRDLARSRQHAACGSQGGEDVE